MSVAQALTDAWIEVGSNSCVIELLGNDQAAYQVSAGSPAANTSYETLSASQMIFVEPRGGSLWARAVSPAKKAVIRISTPAEVLRSPPAIDISRPEIRLALEAQRRTRYSAVKIAGSIANGGAAQLLMGANPARAGGWVQNLSPNDLYLLEDAATATSASAGAPSIRIPAGQIYAFEPTYIPLGIVSIYGAGTGQAFSAREW